MRGEVLLFPVAAAVDVDVDYAVYLGRGAL
jgi:hypothetical protein